MVYVPAQVKHILGAFIDNGQCVHHQFPERSPTVFISFLNSALSFLQCISVSMQIYDT